MNDITKCTGDNCPIHLKDRCYRYLAKDGGRQAYFAESPIEDGNEECEMYWKAKDVEALDKAWDEWI